MQRPNCNSIPFDGIIADCDVCAVRKGKQLAHPKKAQHAGITRPFQLCSSDLMGPFTPEAHGGFKYVSKITDQFTRWIAGLLGGEHKLRLRLLSPICHINCHSLRWPSRLLACRQSRGIHERSVQAVLLGNGHYPGVCGHQYASEKWRVCERWQGPFQYGSLPSRRQ